jgi:hypothetical protein
MDGASRIAGGGAPTVRAANEADATWVAQVLIASWGCV